MSFQNLPAQLTALLLGWLFTLYLQHVSNRRTEALKRKDKIIDKLDDLADWVEGETTKDEFDPSYTEEAYSGLILQIELRINQFNSHVGRDAIKADQIAALRDVDFFNEGGLGRLPYDVRSTASVLVEHIELSCDSIYFNKTLLRRMGGFLAELYGVIVSLVALILLFVLIKVLSWVFFS